METHRELISVELTKPKGRLDLKVKPSVRVQLDSSREKRFHLMPASDSSRHRACGPMHHALTSFAQQAVSSAPRFHFALAKFAEPV